MSKEEQLLEEAGIKVPPFDEKEFIRKELISFKTTLVLFVLSILVSGGTFLLWRQGIIKPFLGLLIAALTVGLLLVRPVFKLARIDISHWKRKEWIGTAFLFGFFWIGFFLLFTNPPLSDSSDPVVEVAMTPAVQSLNQSIAMAAYVADNVALRGEPAFCVLPTTGTPPESYAELSATQKTACAQTWVRDAKLPVWTTQFTPTETGTYVRFVEAHDRSGRANLTRDTFTVGDPFTIVDPPNRNEASEFIDTSNVFSVQPRAEFGPRLLSVQYRIAGGDWHNFENDKNDPKTWFTKPTYPAWHVGQNSVEIRVVEQSQYLPGGFRLAGGAAQDPRTYSVKVNADYPGLNSAAEPVFNEAGGPDAHRSPSLGVPLAVGGVALVALAWRRRSGND